MITKEVNDWIKKVECKMYSNEEAMAEFINISRYLTGDEILFIKRKLTNNLPELM